MHKNKLEISAHLTNITFRAKKMLTNIKWFYKIGIAEAKASGLSEIGETNN